jgi:predicted branched-subunit amino acid permease
MLPVTGGQRFKRGFAAILPLWLGVVPFALAYAVTARDAGLSLVETQALSVLVFAGGAEIVLTTLLLNVRHALYGMTIGPRLPLRGLRRIVGAYLLTDEAFGVYAAQEDRSFPFLLGVEVSLFVSWNLATLGGAVVGGSIPDPAQYGIDLVFPLAFLALLVPMLRVRVELLVAVAAGLLAWGISRVSTGGLPILIPGVACSLLGAWLTRGESETPE